MFCQIGQAQWLRSPGSFGQLMAAKGLFQRELIQRLGAAAQTGFVSVGTNRLSASMPPTGQPCRAALSAMLRRLAPPQGACAASESTSPRHKRSARSGVVAVVAMLAAQPMAADATPAASAMYVGCCGAKSQSCAPAETPWARCAATATTGSPRRVRCESQVCHSWHPDTGT